MHSKTRQILAFHVGKRGKASAEALMNKLPIELKKSPLLLKISLQLTYAVIPWKQYSPIGKESGKTSYIKRFNCTIRRTIVQD